MFTQQPATKPNQNCLHPEADEVRPCPIIGIYNFSSPVFIWKNHTICSVQLVFKNNNNL